MPIINSINENVQSSRAASAFLEVCMKKAAVSNDPSDVSSFNQLFATHY